jgi:hypothetical protein
MPLEKQSVTRNEYLALDTMNGYYMNIVEKKYFHSLPYK